MSEALTIQLQSIHRDHDRALPAGSGSGNRFRGGYRRNTYRNTANVGHELVNPDVEPEDLECSAYADNECAECWQDDDDAWEYETAYEPEDEYAGEVDDENLAVQLNVLEALDTSTEAE